VVVVEKEGVVQAMSEAASLLVVVELTLALVMTRVAFVVLAEAEAGMSSVHSKSSKRNLQCSFDIRMVANWCYNVAKILL
jgi:hypothetical protein